VEERYCSNCGNRLEPDARFCSSCGRPVHRRTARVPTPEAEARGRTRGPMLALAGVFLILVVVETGQGGMSEAIRVMLVVATVVLVASVISYLSLIRSGGATLGEAVFNWSVVVLAAFATFLFLIS
jgi:zinc-ribbon domain